MVTQDKQYLTQVIEALDQGTAIYQRISNEALSNKAAEVITCIIKTRQFASDFLAKLLAQAASSPMGNHAFGSVLHKLYPDMLDRLPNDFAKENLHAIIQVERTTQSAMHEAIQNVSEPLIKAILVDLNPRLNRQSMSSQPLGQVS